MERNLDFPLTLEEMAAELGLSARSLARACQRQFGETPRAFRMTWRRRQSQTYLPEIRRLSLSARELGGRD